VGGNAVVFNNKFSQGGRRNNNIGERPACICNEPNLSAAPNIINSHYVVEPDLQLREGSEMQNAVCEESSQGAPPDAEFNNATIHKK